MYWPVLMAALRQTSPMTVWLTGTSAADRRRKLEYCQLQCKCSGDTRQPYSMSANAYVMIPDQTTVDKAKELMQQVVDGEVVNLNE